jgi:hypothetical protein
VAQSDPSTFRVGCQQVFPEHEPFPFESMNFETLFQLLALAAIVAAGPLIVVLLSSRAESGL